MCVPAPAVAGVKIPVEEVPGPLHVPPASMETNWKAGVFVQTGATGVIVGLGKPDWAPPGGILSVKLVGEPGWAPLQFSTTIMMFCPAKTLGAGTEEEQV